MYSFIVCEPDIDKFRDVSELLYTDQGDLIEAVSSFVDNVSVALRRKYGTSVRVYSVSEPEEIETPRNVENVFKAVGYYVNSSWKIKLKIESGPRVYTEKAYMFEVER